MKDPYDPLELAAEFITTLREVSRRYKDPDVRKYFELDALCREISYTPPKTLSAKDRAFVSTTSRQKSDPAELELELHCAYLLELAFRAIDLNVEDDHTFQRVREAYVCNKSLSKSARNQGKRCLERYLESSRDDHIIVEGRHNTLLSKFSRATESSDLIIAYQGIREIVSGLDRLSPAIINDAAAQKLADLCESYEARLKHVSEALIEEPPDKLSDGYLFVKPDHHPAKKETDDMFFSKMN